MGTKEIEAVRAFCRFADAAVSATALVHNVVRSAVPEENLRSMIETGRVVAKIEQGMESCAIATPSGPVLVGPQRDGGFLITRIDSTEWWCRTPDDLATRLYEALVVAGGPLEDEPPVESRDPECGDGHRQALLGGRESLAQADLLARETVGILQAAAPVVGWRAFAGAVCVERVDAGWEVTKTGVEPATVPPDAWDALWTTLYARLR